VTAEAHHYDELHRLVDRLKPSQAHAAQAVVLQLVAGDSDQALDEADEQPGAWPPPWFGSVTAEDANHVVSARRK
jgi:hypothetical protein